MKFSNNINSKNQRRLNCLVHSALRHPQNFSDFLKYLSEHKEYIGQFNFNEVCGLTFQENTLHLAARTSDIRMVYRLIQLHVVDPFIRNSLNKRGRTITPHYIVRKLLCSYEKTFAR
jgi:hypothetical protein